MATWEIWIQILSLIIGLIVFWKQIQCHRWIKLTLFAFAFIFIAAVLEFPFSRIFELFSQHWEIIELLIIISVIIGCAKYLEYYSKKTYEKIIIEKAKYVSISFRLFDKESSTNTTIKQWKKGICELLYDSLLLLNSGDHQRLIKLLIKTKEILNFTANSNFAYYIKTALKATDNFDEDFLEKEARNITEIIKLKWISPPYIPKVNLFLKSLIKEIDSEFSIRESDLSAASFSEFVIPPLGKKYLNIRKITCLNLQLWEKLFINYAKYEDFLNFLFFMLAIVGIFWIPFVLWSVYFWIYLYIVSGIYGARRKLIGESLEFLYKILKCEVKESKKNLFFRLIRFFISKIIKDPSIKAVFSIVYKIIRFFISKIIKDPSIKAVFSIVYKIIRFFISKIIKDPSIKAVFSIVYKIIRFFKEKLKSKKFSTNKAKKLILASELLDNVDWLDEMDEEKRFQNLSILIYLITTFPNKKLRNFTPIETLDYSIDFDLKKIHKSDFVFALKLPYMYLKILLLDLIGKLKNIVDTIPI